MEDEEYERFKLMSFRILFMCLAGITGVGSGVMLGIYARELEATVFWVALGLGAICLFCLIALASLFLRKGKKDES